ncbi:hypothetical protein [Kutzneria chonburiensis]|uniref:Uncharacterized protein n=1 Tax=Kutzneria chonburiensis TaxID=1483604 RepID=A0ABV6MR57_9PSEU|nr:hypothetical protein [Kutzneria chonburiensis]
MCTKQASDDVECLGKVEPLSFLEVQGRLAVAFEASYEELGDAGGLGEDLHDAAELAADVGERRPIVVGMGAVLVGEVAAALTGRVAQLLTMTSVTSETGTFGPTASAKQPVPVV